MTNRVAITTVVRGAALDTPSGWLRILDLERGVELERAPLPDAVHRALDANPRGGLRGGRGIAATSERLAVAINDRVLVLDGSWRVQRVLSHRWMGGVHGIAADGTGLWVTCADNDLVLRLDWDGGLLEWWHWRADRSLRHALGHGWLPSFDRWADHRDPYGGGARIDFGHANAVAVAGDHLLVCLGLIRTPTPVWTQIARARGLRVAQRLRLDPALRVVDGWARKRGFGRTGVPSGRSVGVTPGAMHLESFPDQAEGWSWAIVELPLEDGSLREPTRPRLVARHPAAGRPAHDAVPWDGKVAVTDSPRGGVVAIDRSSGAIVSSVQLPGEFPFPRGLLRLEDSRVVVGTQQPAALFILDLDSESIVERIALPDDQGETPFAIASVPEGFDDAGARLPTTRAGWGIAAADASGGC